MKILQISLILSLAIWLGVSSSIQNNCNMDVAFNVERTYTEVYEDCKLIGYVFDSSYDTITSDNGTIYVIPDNFDDNMYEVVEIVKSENGHIYSTVDFGSLHDMAIPVSSYTRHYYSDEG